MFVSLPLASWWTKSIPDFAVTSSNTSSGPAATGGEDGSAGRATAVPLPDVLRHPGASHASASADAAQRTRFQMRRRLKPQVTNLPSGTYTIEYNAAARPHASRAAENRREV